jgi:hypothetical protein
MSLLLVLYKKFCPKFIQEHTCIYLFKFYTRLFETFFHKRYNNPLYIKNKVHIKNIGILFCIPSYIPRFNTKWNDGFADAVNKLGSDYSITWINIATENLSEEYLNTFDFLLVKANWNDAIDNLL